MRPKWPKLASLAQKTCTLDSFQFFGVILPKDNPFIENISIIPVFMTLMGMVYSLMGYHAEVQY